MVENPSLSQVLETARSEILEVLGSSDWTFLKSVEGTENFWIETDRPVPLMKTLTTFNITPEQFIDFLTDTSRKSRWEKRIIEATRLQDIPEAKGFVCHETYKTPFLVSNRDFLWALGVYEQPNGLLCVIRSVDIDHPAASGFVRAKINHMGFLAEHDPDGCKVTYVNEVDPCGKIPDSFKARAAKNSYKTLLAMKAALLVN